MNFTSIKIVLLFVFMPFFSIGQIELSDLIHLNQVENKSEISNYIEKNKTFFRLQYSPFDEYGGYGKHYRYRQHEELINQANLRYTKIGNELYSNFSLFTLEELKSSLYEFTGFYILNKLIDEVINSDGKITFKSIKIFDDKYSISVFTNYRKLDYVNSIVYKQSKDIGKNIKVELENALYDEYEFAFLKNQSHVRKYETIITSKEHANSTTNEYVRPDVDLVTGQTVYKKDSYKSHFYDYEITMTLNGYIQFFRDFRIHELVKNKDSENQEILSFNNGLPKKYIGKENNSVYEYFFNDYGFVNEGYINNDIIQHSINSIIINFESLANIKENILNVPLRIIDFKLIDKTNNDYDEDFLSNRNLLKKTIYYNKQLDPIERIIPYKNNNQFSYEDLCIAPSEKLNKLKCKESTTYRENSEEEDSNPFTRCCKNCLMVRDFKAKNKDPRQIFTLNNDRKNSKQQYSAHYTIKEIINFLDKGLEFEHITLSENMINPYNPLLLTFNTNEIISSENYFIITLGYRNKEVTGGTSSRYLVKIDKNNGKRKYYYLRSEDPNLWIIENNNVLSYKNDQNLIAPTIETDAFKIDKMIHDYYQDDLIVSCSTKAAKARIEKEKREKEEFERQQRIEKEKRLQEQKDKECISYFEKINNEFSELILNAKSSTSSLADENTRKKLIEYIELFDDLHCVSIDTSRIRRQSIDKLITTISDDEVVWNYIDDGSDVNTVGIMVNSIKISKISYDFSPSKIEYEIYEIIDSTDGLTLNSLLDQYLTYHEKSFKKIDKILMKKKSLNEKYSKLENNRQLFYLLKNQKYFIKRISIHE